MRKILRYSALSIFILLTFLVIFNPSPAAFKEFARGHENPNYYIYRRTANYLIYSIYLKEGPDINQKYLGIIGNFFTIADDEIP
jgi:hypothetical protein